MVASIENENNASEFILKHFKLEGDKLFRFNLKNKAWTEVNITKSNNGGKYIKIRVNGKNFYAHRLIWFVKFKRWPYEGLEIDHINRNPTDNRIENLREVTKSENLINSYSNQASYGNSKYLGVRISDKKYRSNITVINYTIELGTFSTEEEAAKARDNYIVENNLQDRYLLNNISDDIIPISFKSKCTSKYRGVHFWENEWRSKVGINHKQIKLGTFPTEEEAARARDKYVIENNLQDRYKLNFPQ